jgi:hypothetical protein
MWPFLGSGRGASSPAPAGGHGHKCYLLCADLDSTFSAQLVVAERGGGNQAALAQSFSTVGLMPPVGTKWIADSGASYHTTPDAGILFFRPTSSPLLSFLHHGR